MERRRTARLLGWAVVLLSAFAVQPLSADRAADLKLEIDRLESEVARLQRSERTVLDQLERLSAELNLAEARRREVEFKRENAETTITELDAQLKTLREEQTQRRDYLSFRLREVYKGGEADPLRRLLADGDGDAYWDGLRYAGYLNERDRRVLSAYRKSAEEATVKRDAQRIEQERFQTLSEELRQRRASLRTMRNRQNRMLSGIRDDKAQRAAAIAELTSAVDALGSFVAGLESEVAALDVRKFRGLLDWPAEGRLRNGFGQVVHPRFKTRVPHPGLDIAAKMGAPIHAVFDGEVAFSGWMRGYGLTTVLDHGGGVHSVYAHASVSWVEPGEKVTRGQRIALVGETGSLRGAALYFELRDQGKAVDPEKWLRER